MASKKQPELRIELPPLHPAQMEVARSPARFRVLAAGAQFGKTRLGVCLCVEEALLGGLAWWIAPSFPLANIGWELLQFLAAQIPNTTQKIAERRIIFPNGGEVAIKSADEPASLRGMGLDLAVFEEAAYMKEEAWTASIRPRLSAPHRKGKALFISTFAGRNWFWTLWKEAGGDEGIPIESKKDLWQAWRFPTSANPYINPEEIERAKQELPDLVFATEYLALPVEHVGAMFRREWFKIASQLPDGRYVRFWDLAASPVGDYSVGTKAGLVDGKFVVADVVRGRWDWPSLRRVIVDTALEDGPEVHVGIEQAASDLRAVQDLLSEPELAKIVLKGVPIQTAKASVRALYDNLPRDKAAKAARAASWLARAEAGNVMLVEAPWNKAWLDEVTDFPLSGVPDDQVDSMSGAVAMIGKPREISFGWI